MKYIFLLLLVLVACSGNDGVIDVRMPIPFVESHALPFVLAEEKGFYAEEGLTVHLNPASNELNPVKAVLSGSDEIAYLGGPDTLLVAKGREAPLVALSHLYQQANFVGIMALEGSNITTVQDLEGKKLGMYYGHISTDIIRPLLKQENVTVVEKNVLFNFNALADGTIDAMFDFKTFGPLVMELKVGKNVTRIHPQDYGITSYGYTLFTSEKFLEENPENVRKFLRATHKGLRYMVEHPEEAVAILEEQYDLDPAFESRVVTLLQELYQQYCDGRPLGWISEESMQEAYERLDAQGLIEDAFDPKTAYAVEYLDNDLIARCE